MDRRLVVRVAISVGLLVVIIYRAGIDSIADILSDTILWMFLIALFVENLGVILSAKKWHILLKSRCIDIGYGETIQYYYMGSFFNAMMPTSFGGDAIKAYKLGKKTDSVETFSTAIMDRITGLVAVILIAIAGILSSYTFIPLSALLISVALICAFFILFALLLKTNVIEKIASFALSRWKNIHIFILRVIASIKSYRDRKILAQALAISFTFHVILIMNNYLLSRSLSMDIDLRYFFIFIPLAEILVALPITIQGFGVREGSYALLFSSVGAPYATAFSLGFLNQIVKLLTSIIGGVVYVSKK